jgi:hypothetical protein
MLDTLSNLFSPAAYLNPWSVLAGLLLIASPIIIHLINRMRYKRIRWAAMEFLLKAQKKMRRKMIIEQLLLLILRCLLMLLAGLLVGRFFGFDMSGKESKLTQHYVILDDSPSMADPIQGEGVEQIDAFERAKRVLAEKIAPASAEATTPQMMDVLRASDPENPLAIGRLNPTSIQEMKNNLAQFRPSTVRSNLAQRLKTAGDRLLSTGGPETARVMHVLSDFRSEDWSEMGEAVKEEVKRLSEGGVKVHFIDVAHPDRKADRKLPLFHDNIGIIELKPMKAVVAKYEEVEFTLKVQNFGAAEVKDTRVSIRVNGDENKGGRSVVFATLPPGQVMVEKFVVNFDRAGDTANPFEGKTANSKLSEDEKGAMKKALERFNIVSAVIETKETGGLEADNVRHTCVEVRQQLPILVVDGDPEKRDRREGDSLYLQKFIGSSGSSYQWVAGTTLELSNSDLTKYSFVLILNVATLPPPAIKNLESYVANGGGCGFWLGGLVKPDEYNKGLYRNGEGLFPVPLPKDTLPALGEELNEEELLRKKFNIFQKKILLKDPANKSHPALSGLYTDTRGAAKDQDEIEKFFRFVTFKRYFAVERIGKWVEDRSVTELYCMPNDKPLSNYERDAVELANALPETDPEFAKFKDVLGKLKRAIGQVPRTTDGTTSQLADLFDRLLSDQRAEGDADEALLREFWADARNNDLRIRVARLRDRMKYGYPLYFAKTFGRGRVTLVTTTAGEAWNDWPSEQPGSVSYIPVMKELTNYLAGGGVDDNRTCGKPLELKLDPESYDRKVLRGFITHAAKPGERPVVGGQNDPAPIQVAEQFDPLVEEKVKEKIVEKDGEKVIEREVERNLLVARVTDTSVPGIYLFGLEQKRPKPGSPNETVSSPEYRFVPVNLDATKEGDLRRASEADVLSQAPGAALHGPEDKEWIESLKNKKSDLSELGWIFLILLLVLVAEQALAVRLSYHSSPDSLSDAAPTAAAAIRRTQIQTAGEGAGSTT